MPQGYESSGLIVNVPPLASRSNRPLICACSMMFLNAIDKPLFPPPALLASVGNTGALPMPRVCLSSQAANCGSNWSGDRLTCFPRCNFNEFVRLDRPRSTANRRYRAAEMRCNTRRELRLSNIAWRGFDQICNCSRVNTSFSPL